MVGSSIHGRQASTPLRFSPRSDPTCVSGRARVTARGRLLRAAVVRRHLHARSAPLRAKGASNHVTANHDNSSAPSERIGSAPRFVDWLMLLVSRGRSGGARGGVGQTRGVEAGRGHTHQLGVLIGARWGRTRASRWPSQLTTAAHHPIFLVNWSYLCRCVVVPSGPNLGQAKATAIPTNYRPETSSSAAT